MIRHLLEWWLRCHSNGIVIRFPGSPPVPPPEEAVRMLIAFLVRLA